ARRRGERLRPEARSRSRSRTPAPASRASRDAKFPPAVGFLPCPPFGVSVSPSESARATGSRAGRSRGPALKGEGFARRRPGLARQSQRGCQPPPFAAARNALSCSRFINFDLFLAGGDVRH